MFDVQHKLPQLRTIVQYTGTPPLSDQRRLHRSHGKHILSWAQVGSAVQAGQCSVVQLAEIGAALPDIKLDERLRRVAVNQVSLNTFIPKAFPSFVYFYFVYFYFIFIYSVAAWCRLAGAAARSGR